MDGAHFYLKVRTADTSYFIYSQSRVAKNRFRNLKINSLILFLARNLKK